MPTTHGTAETRVLRGLPIEVSYTISPPSPWDGDPGAIDWEITAIGGKPTAKRPEWLYSRLTRRDETQIEEACCYAASLSAW